MQLTQETFLCNWNDFDIYDVIVPRKKAPSKFSFALRMQEKFSKAQDTSNYVCYFCVEDEAVMGKWISAVRNAKVDFFFLVLFSA